MPATTSLRIQESSRHPQGKHGCEPESLGFGLAGFDRPSF